MSRKMTAFILTVAMTVGLFTGCGSGNNAKSSDTLVVWTNMEVETETIQKYAKQWAEETGHKVEVMHESPDVQQFAQATNSPSGPDVVVGIPNDQLADYVNAGLAVKVPEGLYADEDFSDASIQACYVEGERYAAPLAVETVTLFYNTDKISQAPETWEELAEVAKDCGGVQFDASSIYYDLGFVRACGGYIFKYENGSYDVADIGLANEGAVEAYEFIQSLNQDYGYVSSDITADIARSNFQNGETAFYIGGPWDIEGFTSAGTKFAVCEMPTFHGNPFVTPVGTQVSFVSAKSKKQEMAWEFVMYLIDNGAVEMFEAGGRIPAKLSEQEKPEIKEDEMSAAFIAQINDGEPMPTVSELGQLWEIYSNNIKSMFQGDIEPADMGENIVSQLQEAIELMDSGK